MSRVRLVALLLLGACAHEPPVESLRVRLMSRCAEACSPARAVGASVTVDRTDDLWQCLCRPVEMMTEPGT
jgi:hypothetical protein